MLTKNAKSKFLLKIFSSFLLLCFSTNSLFAQTLSTIPSCDSTSCLTKPSNIALSSDGSFLLVLDSLSTTSSYIRKLKFNNGSFIDESRISLNQIGDQSFSTSISKDDKKALVYSSSLNNSRISTIDLTNNSLKQIFPNSLTAGLTLGVPAFLDSNGKKIIVGTLSVDNPELLIIDSATSAIQKRIPVLARIDSVNVSPDSLKVVLTHNTPLTMAVSVYDPFTDKINVINTENISINSGSVQDIVKFDLFSSKAVISSLSGNHVLHLLDLKTNKLQSKSLDLTLSGPVISTVSPDGMTIISAGDVLSDPSGFQLYRTNISPNGTLDLSQSFLFNDESIVFDIDITPDQSKVVVLLVKSGKKFVKIVDINDFSKAVELELSADNGNVDLLVDPNGRYIVTQNVFSSPAVNLISGLNLNPILKSITPTSIKLKELSPFTISSFIDLSRFSNDVKVCFTSEATCASKVVTSPDGSSISGVTPSISSPGFYDVLLIGKSNSTTQTFKSNYQGVFKVDGDTTGQSDTATPLVVVFAPQEGRSFNSRKVRVLGSADGTGSPIKSVLVNGQAAILTPDNLNKNLSRFSTDAKFTKDGASDITVSVEDSSGNKAETSVKVLIDTVLPSIMATAVPSGSGFDVVGTVDGTGSKVLSVFVNGAPVDFEQDQIIDFSAQTTDAPINIFAIDAAGNRSELNISNPLSDDVNPPTITVLSPLNGDVLNSNSVNVTFTVTDSSKLKEVILNGENIPVSQSGSYSQSVDLDPGENIITIDALDSSDNESSVEISVFNGAESTEPEDDDLLPEDQEIINLPEEISDLNNELIDEFNKLAEDPDFGLSLLGSLEISNPPPVPDGSDASVDIPQVEGLDPNAQEVPQGFSFASRINFSGSETTSLSDGQIDGQNTVLLTDSTGKTFLVGFALLKEVTELAAKVSGRHYKYQTSDGVSLDLLTTVNIPPDASPGDAKISVLNGNESIATINLRITSSQDVAVGDKLLGKPQIKTPITAIVKGSGKKLTLKITGDNFIGKSAVIDGQLEKLLGKAKFFTNVTFVPDDGIRIKKLQVVKKKSIVLSVELKSDIQPGIKFFNVITPKGSDVGAITIPNPITDGELETTDKVENLILETIPAE